MGFSRNMIETMLPEPELAPNPHYLSASPMKQYRAEDVYAVMATEEFAILAEKHKRKSETAQEAAKKAAVTREENLVNHAKAIAPGFRVPSVEEERLLAEALERQADYYNEKDWQMSATGDHPDYKGEYGDMADAVHLADDKTKERWMLNYLLYAYTDYPRIKRYFTRKKNGGRAACIIRHTFYTKAAEANPYLADACAEKLKELSYDVGYHPEDYVDRK